MKLLISAAIYRARFDDRPTELLVVTGDVLAHAVQLANPDIAYANEADPALARETRRALLARDAVLATAHLTQPFHALGNSS